MATSTLPRPRETLAPGAPAPAGMVPLCVPELAGNEWAYVKECLDTGWVSSVGAFVDRFEAGFAARVGTRHAIATTCGTAALHVALQLAGVGPDDEVLVPALTFIAPANAVRYVGAWPVFIDVDARHWQMDPDRVRDFLERGCAFRGGVLRNRVTGRRVAAMLPVHLLGHPVDAAPLLELAARYGLRLVEDATESLGASYRGTPVGHLGEMACFSFNGNKLLTTGGGGMLVTDDDRLAARARYLTTQAKDDAVEYVHREVGYNYRLTNVLAAMGLAQLERLDAHVAAKRRIAARYAETLGDVSGLTPMAEAPWAESVFWMYTLTVDPERFGTTARGLMAQLGCAGVQTRPLWQPLHRSPAHAGAYAVACPVADRVHAQALSLPCSVGLTTADQDRVIAAVRAAGNGAA
ncbi:MAG: LegC family aminotransferase [Gemmatirosa sp.]